jgi:hypothetical protein
MARAGKHRKALEQRIALAWLALSNAERNGEWARATQQSGMILRLETQLADLRKSSN